MPLLKILNNSTLMPNIRCFSKSCYVQMKVYCDTFYKFFLLEYMPIKEIEKTTKLLTLPPDVNCEWLLFSYFQHFLQWKCSSSVKRRNNKSYFTNKIEQYVKREKKQDFKLNVHRKKLGKKWIKMLIMIVSFTTLCIFQLFHKEYVLLL